MLPLFVFGPIFAWVVVFDRLGKNELARIFALGALLLPAIQMLGLYYNAGRYAVGVSNQPLIFFGHAQWEPPLGWYLWLGIGFTGCVMLGLVLTAFGRTGKPADLELSSTVLT